MSLAAWIHDARVRASKVDSVSLRLRGLLSRLLLSEKMSLFVIYLQTKTEYKLACGQTSVIFFLRGQE